MPNQYGVTPDNWSTKPRLRSVESCPLFKQRAEQLMICPISRLPCNGVKSDYWANDPDTGEPLLTSSHRECDAFLRNGEAVVDCRRYNSTFCLVRVTPSGAAVWRYKGPFAGFQVE